MSCGFGGGRIVLHSVANALFCSFIRHKTFGCGENVRVHDPEIPLLRPAAVTSLREEYSNFSVQYFIRTSRRSGVKEFRRFQNSKSPMIVDR